MYFVKERCKKVEIIIFIFWGCRIYEKMAPELRFAGNIEGIFFFELSKGVG